LFKGKLVRDPKVEKYDLPSFEGVAEPGRGGRPVNRPVPKTPEDLVREEKLKGFEEWRLAGIEAIEREAIQLLAGLRSAVESVDILRAQILREAETQIVTLAVAIARRILIEEISVNPGLIAATVKEAIRKIERPGPVTVKVHPDLYNLIAGINDGVAESPAEIIIDIDPSVPPAGPVVTGTTEEILIDVDEQIRVIVEEIRSERASR
jgi:flagellar assembly protein FliH